VRPALGLKQERRRQWSLLIYDGALDGAKLFMTSQPADAAVYLPCVVRD
jgi:hypothetical protein